MPKNGKALKKQSLKKGSVKKNGQKKRKSPSYELQLPQSFSSDRSREAKTEKEGLGLETSAQNEPKFKKRKLAHAASSQGSSSSSSSSGSSSKSSSSSSSSSSFSQSSSSAPAASQNGRAPMDLDEDDSFQEHMQESSPKEASPKSGSKKEKFEQEFSEAPGFDGIHLEDLRALGLNVARGGDAKEFKTYLDNVSYMKHRGKKLNKDKQIDMLCYVLFGSAGRFGFCLARANLGFPRRYAIIPYIIFDTENWELFDIAFDYLLMRLKDSSHPKAAKYPRQKLLNFIGKAFIVHFAKDLAKSLRNNQIDPEPKFNTLKKFIEKYKIDISAETEVPIPFKESSYNRSNEYDGYDPFEAIIKIGTSKYGHVKPSKTLTANDVHIRHLMLDFVSKRKNLHTLQQFRQLLEYGCDYQDINLFWAQNVKLESSEMNADFLAYALSKDLDKNVIQAFIRRPGFQMTLPEKLEDLRKLRTYAIHYGLKNLYQAISQKLKQLNDQYEHSLPLQEHPIYGLINSRHFDLASLEWLNDELSLDSAQKIVEDLEFYKIFNTWFSDFVLGTKTEPQAEAAAESSHPDSGDDSDSDIDSQADLKTSKEPIKIKFKNKFDFTAKDMPKEQNEKLMSVLNQMFDILRLSAWNVHDAQKTVARFEIDLINSILASKTENIENLKIIVGLLFEDKSKAAKEHSEYNAARTTLLRATFEGVTRIQETDAHYVSDRYKILMLIVTQLMAVGEADPVTFLFHILPIIYPEASKKSTAHLKDLRDLAREAVSSVRFLLDRDHYKKALTGLLNQYCRLLSSYDIKGMLLDFLFKIPGLEEMADWEEMLKNHLFAMPHRVMAGVNPLTDDSPLGSNEIDELEITKFLCSKTNVQFPKEIEQNYRSYTTFEFLFYMNRLPYEANKIMGIPHHIDWLKTLVLHQKEIGEAEREATLMLQYDLAVGQMKFDKTLEGRRSLSMALIVNKCLTQAIAVLSLTTYEPHDKISEEFNKNLGPIFMPLIYKEATDFFMARYQLSISEQDKVNLKRMQEIFQSMVSNKDFINGKRTHEIWQLKSLRAFTFTVNLLNHSKHSKPPFVFEKRLLANIYAIILIGFKKLPPKELIDNLASLDEQYFNLTQMPEDNAHLDKDTFLKYLYHICTSIPGFNDKIKSLAEKMLFEGGSDTELQEAASLSPIVYAYNALQEASKQDTSAQAVLLPKGPSA